MGGKSGSWSGEEKGRAMEARRTELRSTFRGVRVVLPRREEVEEEGTGVEEEGVEEEAGVDRGVDKGVEWGRGGLGVGSLGVGGVGVE